MNEDLARSYYRRWAYRFWGLAAIGFLGAVLYPFTAHRPGTREGLELTSHAPHEIPWLAVLGFVGFGILCSVVALFFGSKGSN